MNYDKPFEENKVPFGSLEEEVADDIPVMLSEGEYVIPADVVRYWGIKHLEEMHMMAKCGLMSMQQDGRLHKVDEDGEPVETKEQDKPQLEIVEVDIQAMQDDMSDQEEDDKEDNMDEQMELFEDNVIEVDFDGKDKEEIEEEDNVLKMMMGGMGEPSGPNDGVGGGVAGEDDETGLGVATPEEMQELQEGLTEMQEATQNIVGIEKPIEYADLYDRVTKDFSNAELAQARTYGLLNNEKGLQALDATPDKVGFVDAVANARHEHDPTSAQLDLNELTEKGFQTENPGVVGFTNTLAGILSGVSPAIAATLAIGNVINAATGKEGIGGSPFGLDISGAIGDQLSGIAQDIIDFSETVPGNIEDTVDAGVEAGEEVGSADEDSSKKQKTFPDLKDLVKQTMQIEGIDKEIPIKNSLMSPTSTT